MWRNVYHQSRQNIGINILVLKRRIFQRSIHEQKKPLFSHVNTGSSSQRLNPTQVPHTRLLKALRIPRERKYASEKIQLPVHRFPLCCPHINDHLTEQIRCYRARRGGGDRSPVPGNTTPDLMDFPWVIYPSILYTLRNWFFVTFIISPYLDREFTTQSFMKGAKQAFVRVSQLLSAGNFEDLNGLVTDDSLKEIKRNYSLMTLKQRLELSSAPEDVFFSFPYQIGIIFEEGDDLPQRIFVEITMCFHIFRGFEDYLSRHEGSIGIQQAYNSQDRISVANYRFIREFTSGVEDQWTINVINHFKPGEHMKKS
ncbi:m-AAA protease-interacting protein 1, mitochondrial [Oratosquilla oratoria]|uniref:m-AAA protease-interacting protein 1, mitochondrial n=1 Tax=Oratosquilla oratoria TaxID=337810 RepID=UPI003F75E09E